MIILYTRMMQKNLTKGWDFSSIARLLVMMVAIGLYLGITHWADDLETITFLIIISCVIGFVIAYSKLSGSEVVLTSILLCFFVIFIFLGFTLEGQSNLFDRIFTVLFQIGQAINQLFHNQPLENPMFFLFSISTGFWFIGFFSSFSLVRSNNPWISIWLGASSLILIDLFVPSQNKNWLLTAVFFLFTLLLLTRLFFNKRKMEWEKMGVYYEPNSKLDINGNIILISILIILLAWFIPVITDALTPGTTEQERVRNYFSNLSDRLNNVFAPLNKTGEETYVQNGSILNLGNSIGSSEEQIFSVQSSKLPPSGFRFYWRARVYDYYDGREWSTSDYSQVTYPSASQIQEIPQGQSSIQYEFTFQPSKRLGIYFTSGDILSMDRPGEMLFFRTAENGNDLIALFPLHLMQANESYRIQSIVAFPTQEQMINSGKTYPISIKDHYLQLPQNVPSRLVSLANEITKGLSNPYEKVIAITKYLRSNIHYEKKVPTIPKSRDLVDWLLFDWKKGFCTYYASAEVVLLRAAGIPARIAVGFAQGERIGSGNTYEVLLKDSHAWPEVYFNGTGWVVFEPTVIYSSLKYSSENLNNGISPLSPEEGGVEVPIERYRIPPSDSNISVDSDNVKSQRDYTLLVIFIGVILFLFLCFGLLLLISYRKMKAQSLPGYIIKIIDNKSKVPPTWLRKWASYEEMVPVERSFRSIMRVSKRAGIQIATSKTPQENFQAIVDVIPDADSSAKIFLKEYERASFGRKRLNIKKVKLSTRKLKNLIRTKTISGYFNNDQNRVN